MKRAIVIVLFLAATHHSYAADLDQQTLDRECESRTDDTIAGGKYTVNNRELEISLCRTENALFFMKERWDAIMKERCDSMLTCIELDNEECKSFLKRLCEKQMKQRWDAFTKDAGF